MTVTAARKHPKIGQNTVLPFEGVLDRRIDRIGFAHDCTSVA